MNTLTAQDKLYIAQLHLERLTNLSTLAELSTGKDFSAALQALQENGESDDEMEEHFGL